MACSDYTHYINALADFAFRDAILCPFQDTMGGLVFALTVMGFVALALYFHSDSLIVPWTAMMTTGGVILPQVSSVGVTIGTLVFATVIAGAPVAVIRKLETRP